MEYVAVDLFAGLKRWVYPTTLCSVPALTRVRAAVTSEVLISLKV